VLPVDGQPPCPFILSPAPTYQAKRKFPDGCDTLSPLSVFDSLALIPGWCRLGLQPKSFHMSLYPLIPGSLQMQKSRTTKDLDTDPRVRMALC